MRGLTGAQRVALGLQMFEFAVDVLTQSVRAQHPDWSVQHVEAEVARRLHGDAA